MLLAGDRLFVASAGEVECFSLAGDAIWYDALRSKAAGPAPMPMQSKVVEADPR
jgi:hypothetical protein